MPLETVKLVLQLYPEQYSDFNVRHFHKKLVAKHDIKLSYMWVKKALQGAGVVKTRGKRRVHRKWRPQRPVAGRLLHIDASQHQWFSFWDFIRTTGMVLVLFLSLANFNCQTGAIPNNSGANNSSARSLEGGSVPTYGYEVVNTWPHDTEAYTQGLVFWDGSLLESTGREGWSSLRRVELQSGKVLQKLMIPGPYFAEGITLLKGKVFQLTWQHQRGFIYDPSTFAKLGEFTYSGEGWGLTNDGESLILSDGTNRLRFLDPVNFQLKKSIAVFDGRKPITNLNELEFVQSEVYANVWHTDQLARIDPQTGRVTSWIDLKGLLSRSEVSDEEAVLNGIAYDEIKNRLFVTGKLWPKLFEIRIVQNRER